MYMTSAQLRRAFLDFFASKGHQIVASSSLIPGNDPTLLFTNAQLRRSVVCVLVVNITI